MGVKFYAPPNPLVEAAMEQACAVIGARGVRHGDTIDVTGTAEKLLDAALKEVQAKRKRRETSDG